VTFRYTSGLPCQENTIRMLWRKTCNSILLSGALTLPGSILADEGISDFSDAGKASPAAQDRAFEGKVHRLLDQLADSAARYVTVTRFGNTILITGEVKSSSDANVVDALVLAAAGIRRETPAGSVVMPGRDRVYNHLAVGASDPPMKVAKTNLLLAETMLELVDAGHPEVLDRAAMRMVAQDGVLYILGKPGDTERTRIKAMLMALPGVTGVSFYPE